MSTPPEPDAFEELKRRRADETASRQMFRVSGVGLEFALAIGGLAAVGWWLDRRFGTSPAYTLAGVGLGFALGLYRLVTFAKRSM